LYDNGTVGEIERLLVDAKESLAREIREVSGEVRDGFAHLNARFDTQAARLDRHAGW